MTSLNLQRKLDKEQHEPSTNGRLSLYYFTICISCVKQDKSVNAVTKKNKRKTTENNSKFSPNAVWRNRHVSLDLWIINTFVYVISCVLTRPIKTWTRLRGGAVFQGPDSSAEQNRQHHEQTQHSAAQLPRYRQQNTQHTFTKRDDFYFFMLPHFFFFFFIWDFCTLY